MKIKKTLAEFHGYKLSFKFNKASRGTVSSAMRTRRLQLLDIDKHCLTCHRCVTIAQSGIAPGNSEEDPAGNIAMGVSILSPQLQRMCLAIPFVHLYWTSKNTFMILYFCETKLLSTTEEYLFVHTSSYKCRRAESKDWRRLRAPR